MATGLDLILVSGISVEECLDFQFVHPATQAVPESSLEPKVKTAKSPSQEYEKHYGSLHYELTRNVSEHSPGPPQKQAASDIATLPEINRSHLPLLRYAAANQLRIPSRLRGASVIR